MIRLTTEKGDVVFVNERHILLLRPLTRKKITDPGTDVVLTTQALYVRETTDVVIERILEAEQLRTT